MKILPLQNISFNKHIMAKGAIVKDNKTAPCNIYELDITDFNYLIKLKRDTDWNYSDFLKGITSVYRIKQGYIHSGIYSLEDENERCLSLCTTEEAIDNSTEIGLIETKPDCSSNNKNRRYKYIGETMLAFVASISKAKKRNSVKIDIPLKRAYPFYLKSFFECKNEEDSIKMVLPNKKFKKLISQNSKHTGKKVELVK